MTPVPEPDTLITVELLNDNNVQLSFPTEAGLTYILQTSIDLQVWGDLTTTAGDGAVFEFVHIAGGGDAGRYYRAHITIE